MTIRNEFNPLDLLTDALLHGVGGHVGEGDLDKQHLGIRRFQCETQTPLMLKP
jgi:hypothetical protein